MNGKEEIIEAGHMILYKPREMQRYVYYAQTGQKFTVKAAKGQKLYVMVKARTKSAVGKTYRVTVKQK